MTIIPSTPSITLPTPVPKIEGRPTYSALDCLRAALYENTMSVPSTQGNYGHVGMIMSAADYQLLPGQPDAWVDLPGSGLENFHRFQRGRVSWRAMDLKNLFERSIISQHTIDWIAPLDEKERTDLEEIRTGAISQRLFDSDIDAGDSDDSTHGEELGGLLESRSIELNGIEVRYACDGRSSGHGNTIWHASIAACLHVEKLLAEFDERPLRVLELGAGAAVPSLFVANSVAKHRRNWNDAGAKPTVHITDAKECHNIRQILISVSRQPEEVTGAVQFVVSPHNWGAHGAACLLEQECLCKTLYDLIIVSDCIYNPDFHDALVDSIAALLKKPGCEKVSGADNDDGGGIAVVTFSLHKNTSDDNVWKFFQKVEERKADVGFRLRFRPADDTRPAISATIPRAAGGGWQMEDVMKELQLWKANMNPSRWVAYVYQITWALAEESA